MEEIDKLTPDSDLHKKQGYSSDHIDYMPNDFIDYCSFDECDYGNDNFIDNLNF